MFLRNGAIYIIKKNKLNHNFIGNKPIAFLMPKERSMNIDDIFDLKIVRCLLKK